jgi:hypothetical protein
MGGNKDHGRTTSRAGPITQGAGAGRDAAFRRLRMAFCLLVLGCLAWVGSGHQPARADTNRLHQFYGREYGQVRRQLIRLGYVPLRLQHDRYDECWQVYVQSSCRRYPEILECADRGCAGIFARPKSSALRGPSRYIIVDSVGEFGLEVDSIHPARADDLQEVWARRDLKHRGCRPPGKYYISYRHCDKALQQNLPWWERPLPPSP